MEEAFVLINAHPGKEKEALSAVRALPEAKEVNGVYGVYDIVATLRASDSKAIESAVTKIRSTGSIMATFTMTVNQG